METLQNLLTFAIEFIALTGFGGITLHAIWSSHCKWMNEYCPPVRPFEEPAVEEAVVEPTVEEAVVEPVVEPTVEKTVVEFAVDEEVFVEVTPAQSRYEAMSVKRLRQECQIRCIDWKKGGDYGKAMRKNQMIRALTA